MSRRERKRGFGAESRIAADASAAPSVVMEQFGRLSEMDRSFDIEYWQRQGPAAIYRAAWELVEFHHVSRGGDVNELRLQRTVERFQRR